MGGRSTRCGRRAPAVAGSGRAGWTTARVKSTPVDEPEHGLDAPSPAPACSRSASRPDRATICPNSAGSSACSRLHSSSNPRSPSTHPPRLLSPQLIPSFQEGSVNSSSGFNEHRHVLSVRCRVWLRTGAAQAGTSRRWKAGHDEPRIEARLPPCDAPTWTTPALKPNPTPDTECHDTRNRLMQRGLES